MTAAQGAAAYFAENPTVDEVLATSDGNVWLPADLNRATFHAENNDLDPPATIARDDSGMAAAIAVAELAIAARQARIDASKGTAQETPAPEPVVPPTYEEARAALAEALGIDDLTALEESYTKDGVTINTIDAVIATWYRSGMSVSAWKAQNKDTRQAAVAAEFSDFITLPSPE